MRQGRGVFAGLLLLGLLALPRSASAELVKVGPGGFVVEHRATIATTPDRAWTRLLRIGSWWDSEHTYSGKSENLSLQLSPGGCFCERLAAGGFVKHMEVLFSQPRALLRLSGALGPLQELGLSGALTFALAPTAGGTEVTLTYRVSGFVPDGLEKLSAVVDQVLGQQLTRYAARAGRP